MEKRVVAFFSVLMLGMLISILSVFRISGGIGLAQTAYAQGSYRITVAKTRGTVYDCKLRQLTGKEPALVAAVAPGVESAAALSRVLPPQRMESVYALLQKGKPFSLSLPAMVNAPGLDIFRLEKRYTDEQTACHALGYLDGDGTGISGIERAYDGFLTENQGSISASYRVDALNRPLAGEDHSITDTSYLRRAGVALTLDEDIQKISEKAAASHLERGAVLVTEIPTCKIRAMVSLPNFSPNDIAASLNAPDSPLLNRCLAAYSVGSVFKVVSAAAALEYGVPANTAYICTGAIDADGLDFHCYNSEMHGEQDMRAAIAHSCNTYFVDLMRKIPPQRFLLSARTLGFGQETELAPGFFSAAGTLPEVRTLSQSRALANFSFGQGELTATPLQISAMLNAVAAGGVYTVPSLVLGTVDVDLQPVSKPEEPLATPVISESTAELLQGFMAESVNTGTSRSGKPNHLRAGAKTATAQTGKFDANGIEEVVSWFAGFYPLDSPKYVITVMGEGGTGGGAMCGPVFKEICDDLYDAGLLED